MAPEQMEQAEDLTALNPFFQATMRQEFGLGALVRKDQTYIQILKD